MAKFDVTFIDVNTNVISEETMIAYNLRRILDDIILPADTVQLTVFLSEKQDNNILELDTPRGTNG